MYYTIYKITNIINDKVYIGAHKTPDLNDNYMGSGKALSNALKKYGVESFVKEYLYIFDSSEEMFSKEAEIVNELFVQQQTNYNLRQGGFGGFDYINENGLNGTHRGVDTRIELLKSDWRLFWKEKQQQGVANISKDKVARAAKQRVKTNRKNNGDTAFKTFSGRRHTSATRTAISEANKVKQKGERNSQYGTCWIHSLELEKNKKIKKEDLNKWIDSGWLIGRKMKF